MKLKGQCFGLGLMSDSKKDSMWGYDERLCFCDGSSDLGINTFIKGEQFLTVDNSLANKSLEIRINL